MRRLYFSVRSWFTALDRYLRLLFNRRVPRRFGLLRDYFKLRILQLVTPGRTKPIELAGFTIHHVSLAQIREVYEEIFLDRFYEVETSKTAPRIIDAGAQIGLSVLYFKQAFPRSEIICFEPDPVNFEILQKNIADNGLTNVTAHQAALTDKRGRITLYANSLLQGDNAQSINRKFREGVPDEQKLTARKVSGLPLHSFLKQPLDILKIDIEGAEGMVLAGAAKQLSKVGCLLMEYHYERQTNRLDDILRLIEEAGHDYKILAHPTDLASKDGAVAMIYTVNRKHSSVMPIRLAA